MKLLGLNNLAFVIMKNILVFIFLLENPFKDVSLSMGFFMGRPS